MIYARAVTEVMHKGGDIRNGTAVMAEIFNRTYSSIQGFDVRFTIIIHTNKVKLIFFLLHLQDYIDSNGDAEGNYTVISSQDVINEQGKSVMAMKSVGYFHYSSQSSIIPVSVFFYINHVTNESFFFVL